MKKTFLGLYFYLLNTFTVFAERGDFGRDYLLRDDSPFISPMELLGGIILIIGGFWVLMGILHIAEKYTKHIVIALATFLTICLILFIDTQKKPYTPKADPKLERVNQMLREQLGTSINQKQIEYTSMPTQKEQTEENFENLGVSERNNELDDELMQELDVALVYNIGKQKGYSDGYSDGYNESTVYDTWGLIPPTGKGSNYNRNTPYNDLSLMGTYLNGYDEGYSTGVNAGYLQRKYEYERELEERRKAWDEKYSNTKSIFDDPVNGVFIPDRP